MRGELDQSCSANPVAVKFHFNSACVCAPVLCVHTEAEPITGEEPEL